MAKASVVSIANARKRKQADKPADAEVEDKLRSIFGEAADTILEMIEGDDTDSALTLTQKKMLAASISLLPAAEKAVHVSGGRGIYQFTTLVASIQSQIETLKAQQDSRLVADSLCANVVHPTFLTLANGLVNAIYRLKSELRDYIDPADRKSVGPMIDDTARSMAQMLKEQNESLQAKLIQRLSDV